MPEQQFCHGAVKILFLILKSIGYSFELLVKCITKQEFHMLTLAWPGFFVIKVGLERTVKLHVLARGISESR